MNEADIILTSAHMPSTMEITAFISGPAAILWQELNDYIQLTWKATPKLAFSRCSGKPGWNVKYQKSGKSLCTLYPEHENFIVLVVLPLAVIPEVMAAESEFTTDVIELVVGGKPYNGTIWLMIPVTNSQILMDIERLLAIKLSAN
jgi:hypothetical protein